MPKYLEIETKDHIGRLTISRPEVMNALSPEVMREIMEAMQALEADEDVQVIVITGRGRGFSSGGDKQFLQSMLGKQAFEIKDTVYTYFAGGIKAVKLCRKPTIAAVNGPAVAAGCELALACDFRIAGESATFIEAWVNLGLIAPLGGMLLLPRMIGLTRATEMLMLGTPIDAVEAERIGLVNRVVGDGELESATNKFARQLVNGPRLAYTAIKEGLRRGMESSLAAEWEHNVYTQALLLGTEDFKESVQALKEKRRPVYQGK